jgi:hypothetical protein
MGENEFRVRTLDAYHALFDDVTTEKAIGEASPLYLESPVAAARIREEIPDAKILVSLRDPSDRAFSAYMMQVRNARETWRIDEAFDLDVHYVRVGLYYEKLKRYYDRFPAEQIRVLLYDDLKRDTDGFMREIYGYIGVDPALGGDVGRPHNVGGFPKRKRLNRFLRGLSRNDALKRLVPSGLVALGKDLRRRNVGKKPEFPPELRARLIDHYRDDIERVQELIGVDLGAWLEV